MIEFWCVRWIIWSFIVWQLLSLPNNKFCLLNTMHLWKLESAWNVHLCVCARIAYFMECERISSSILPFHSNRFRFHCVHDCFFSLTKNWANFQNSFEMIAVFITNNWWHRLTQFDKSTHPTLIPIYTNENAAEN